MTILGDNIDYTDKDFDSLRARLINLVSSAFPDWSDFNTANFGNILLELFAFTTDVLSFYQDNQARESRITTATQRKNLIALAKLLGYTPSGATAATVNVTLTLESIAPADVTIPAGSTVSTLSITEPVIFQFLSDVTIPAGTLTTTADVENSSTFVDVYQSSGLANQEFILTGTPFIDDSAVITAADGTYTLEASFLSSTSTDKHFTVVVDQNDRATIRFGNGINGAIPIGTVNVTYKTGGGVQGNVVSGSLVKLDGLFTDDNGNSVRLTVTNPLQSSGGADRQSVEAIRTLAPESIRTVNRTVAREDYEINSRKIAEVARALMTTSNEDAGIAENTGILFVIPQGGGVPTQDLKNQVLTQVTETFPNTLTFLVTVADPLYAEINVQSTLYVADGFNAATVRSNVEANLTSYFALTNTDGTENANVDFGFNYKDVNGAPAPELSWSDIFNVIRDTEGVRKLDDTDGLYLNGDRQDVVIDVKEFPTLGTVTLINGDTGGTL